MNETPYLHPALEAMLQQLQAERNQAYTRLGYAQAAEHEALHDLGEWGDRQAEPSAAWVYAASALTIGGLGVVFGLTVFELAIQPVMDSQRGRVIAMAIGMVMSGSTVLSIQSLARSGGAASAAKAVGAALVSALGLFAMRWHLAHGEWAVALGWSALELGMLLLYELQAFAWGKERAVWASVDGPHTAAITRFETTQQGVAIAREELARREAALAQARQTLVRQLSVEAPRLGQSERRAGSADELLNK